ncbi:MAG: orotate phosphoribosyltransferase [Syntrophobacterales bacterium]|nr:orotate phosphoribosyltransferase [Syntrophobacterales bacterium]
MKDRLADLIIERSFRYNEDNPFTLSSGRKSPYYFDCKPTTLDPEGMYLIGNLVFDILKDTDVKAAGGLTLGADPIANALALISFEKGRPIRSFIVRKDAKSHGTRSKIEGNVKPGEKVAVIDDVVTTGASTITAVESAREAGLTVELAVVLIDREEGGRELIERHVSPVVPILTRTKIMARYKEKAAGKS